MSHEILFLALLLCKCYFSHFDWCHYHWHFPFQHCAAAFFNTHSTHSLVKIFHRKRKINSVFLPSSSVNTKSLTFCPCDGKQNENDRTLLGSWHPLEQKTTCSPSFSLSSEANNLVLLMLFHISYSIGIHKDRTAYFIVEFLIPTLVLEIGEERSIMYFIKIIKMD